MRIWRCIKIFVTVSFFLWYTVNIFWQAHLVYDFYLITICQIWSSFWRWILKFSPLPQNLASNLLIFPEYTFLGENFGILLPSPTDTLGSCNLSERLCDKPHIFGNFARFPQNLASNEHTQTLLAHAIFQKDCVTSHTFLGIFPIFPRTSPLHRHSWVTQSFRKD